MYTSRPTSHHNRGAIDSTLANSKRHKMRWNANFLAAHSVMLMLVRVIKIYHWADVTPVPAGHG